AVAFTPERFWTSPLSQARYPVQWRVDTPAGSFEVRALLDDQELDSRGSTGAIYWEGLCDLRNAAGQVLGSGYLEMTGYAQALRL
ncbi:lipocalin family protein, partial [Stenotrophomonas sp. YIM B06876]|uniref:lipocalin family protein n=1 Tax=Stenotrophomonas sp. YIM B06876 TaxID=3060211 RepID=UPI0027385D2B